MDYILTISIVMLAFQLALMGVAWYVIHKSNQVIGISIQTMNELAIRVSKNPIIYVSKDGQLFVIRHTTIPNK